MIIIIIVIVVTIIVVVIISSVETPAYRPTCSDGMAFHWFSISPL